MANGYIELHKFLVRSYANPHVTSLLIEKLYDYFNDSGRVIQINYDDWAKTITVEVPAAPHNQYVVEELKKLFGMFTVELFSNKEYSDYLCSLDYMKYLWIKTFKDYELSNSAQYCVTVLDMSINNETSVFRLNLIN